MTGDAMAWVADCSKTRGGGLGTSMRGGAWQRDETAAAPRWLRGGGGMEVASDGSESAAGGHGCSNGSGSAGDGTGVSGIDGAGEGSAVEVACLVAVLVGTLGGTSPLVS